MPELAVNCLEHLVGTSFPTCYFSHLMEILFHHEDSQAWTSPREVVSSPTLKVLKI